MTRVPFEKGEPVENRKTKLQGLVSRVSGGLVEVEWEDGRITTVPPELIAHIVEPSK